MGTDDSVGFYVAVAAEADEPHLIADIIYSGRQVAAVHRDADTWMVTLYDPFGAQGFTLPLDDLQLALEDAAKRVGAATP